MNIEELKRLAEAATMGPWKVDKWLGARSDDWIVAYDAGDKGRGLAIVNSIYSLSDAKYIAAANPAAVLELIAEVDRLRDEVNGMTGTIARIETERNNQILRNHNLEIELRECRSIISRLSVEGQDAVEM